MKSRYPLFETILIQLIIFISVSPIFENISKIVCSLVVFFILALYKRQLILFNTSNLILLALFTFFLLVYGFFVDLLYTSSVDFIGIGFWASVLIGFLLACIITKDQMLKSNETIMYWSVLIGIPVFLLVQVYPSLVDFALTYSYGGFIHKTFLIVNFHYTEDNNITDRFVGIGREPGVTQIFILLAIWTRLKHIKKFDFKVIILVVGILLSKSTAGFFTLILLLLTVFPKKSLIKLTFFAIPLITYYLTDLWLYHATNKLSSDSLSFINRYGRYIDFFSADLRYILTGFGNAYYAKYISTADLGGWDTLLQVSQRYGLIFFILIVVMLFYSNLNKWVVALIISVSFVSQLIWFYPAIAFFYFKDSSKK